MTNPKFRGIVMEPGLSYITERVFRVKGFKREAELNASIGTAKDHIALRKSWFRQLKTILVADPYFSSSHSLDSFREFLSEDNLPVDLVDPFQMPDDHRTNFSNVKVNFDTIDLHAYHNDVSIQVEKSVTKGNSLCIKLGFGESARVRAELEQGIETIYPDFNVLKPRHIKILEDRLGPDFLNRNLYYWAAMPGWNWSYEFNPGGDRETLIKAKLDLREGITVLTGRTDIVNVELEIKRGDEKKLDEAFGRILQFKLDGRRRLFEETRTKAEIFFAPLDRKLKKIRKEGGLDILEEQLSATRFAEVTGVPGHDL